MADAHSTHSFDRQVLSSSETRVTAACLTSPRQPDADIPVLLVLLSFLKMERCKGEFSDTLAGHF